MRPKIIEHLASVIFIGIVFLVLFAVWGPQKKAPSYQYIDDIKAYTQLGFLDMSDPEDLALLHETLDYYEPDNKPIHDSLVAEIKSYMRDLMLANTSSPYLSAELDINKLISLLVMLFQFAIIYILVLILTAYGVETFAIYRFIRLQQSGSLFGSIKASFHDLITTSDWQNKLKQAFFIIRKLLRGLIKGLSMLTLFAPAYVIAYSFKTRFDTDSVVLMILLSVISNGLLITYTQKYFTFIMSESRKGYVQTAIVKNLNRSYRFSTDKGIRLSSIFRIRKRFPGHIFGHIYQNVRFQYLSTLKEQASFLITGLIIIEMALNIQGHLCYELMQNILYKNLAIVLLIVFGIFVIVKLTELSIDYLIFTQQRKIDNKK